MVQIIVKTLAMTLVVLSFMSCGKDTPSTSEEVRIIEGDLKAITMSFPYETQKYNWKSWYGESIFRYLNERGELSSIIDTEINNYDLKLLKCTSYNSANSYEKKRFWVLFIASIAHAESGLNPNTTFREKDGTLSSGLLQIDVASANRHSSRYTGFTFSQKDLFDPDKNLMAGLYILKHQIDGGIFGERPDIRARLFTQSSYYWSVLTLKKELIIKTFTKNALINLPFCSIGR